MTVAEASAPFSLRAPDGLQLPSLRPGNWLACILLGLYFLNLWDINHFRNESVSWYQVLVLALVAFIFQRSGLSLSGARVLLTMYGLMLGGALLALFRTVEFSQAIYNTVGMVSTGISMLLFVPILATRRARFCMLITLIFAASVLTYQTLLALGSPAYLYTNAFRELAGDKNLVSLCIAMAAVTLTSLALFGGVSGHRLAARPSVRGAALAASGGLVFIISVTYSRSGLLTCLAGLLAVVFCHSVARGVSGWVLGGIGITIIAIVVLIFLPEYIEAYPYWRLNFERVMNWRVDPNMVVRRDLLRKGFEIISENPLIGVGHGLATSTTFGPTYARDFLIHNGYLTMWVELGLLGILALTAWLGALVRELGIALRSGGVLNLTVLLAQVPVVLMTAFIEIWTIVAMSVAIVTAVAYERHVVGLHEPTEHAGP